MTTPNVHTKYGTMQREKMSETPDTDNELQHVSEAWWIALEGPDQSRRADHAGSTIEWPKKRRTPASDRADAGSDAEHEGLLFELGEDDDDRDPG